MSNFEHKKKTDTRELTAGALLILTGCAAAFQALDFDTDSRMFPLIVAILLTMTGSGIAIHAMIRPADGIVLVRKIGPAVVAAMIIAMWAAAFAGGAGFILPTFVMQVALLWSTGLRRPVSIAGIAALVTTLAYLLFVALLDIPLPVSWLPPPLQDF